MPRFPAKPTPAKLEQAYSQGFEGWIWDVPVQREWDKLMSEQPTDTLDDIKGASDKVGRALLWRSRELFDPGAFGKEAQTTGDCVSHGSRTARDTTRSVEIHIDGEPEEYRHRGATEPTYGARGHGGQGMDPARASRFERDCGFLVRRKYDAVDLTKYNSKIGTRWGSRGVPEKVKELCRRHNVGRVHSPTSLEQVLDLLATGHAGHSGQSWGTAKKLGTDGLNRSNRSGWNHDMATVGYDKTEEIWSEPVAFVPNSWGRWNSRNPRWDDDALGPWIPGMIVIPFDEYERYFVRSGSIDFYSSVNGFVMSHLPDYGFGGV